MSSKFKRETPAITSLVTDIIPGLLSFFLALIVAYLIYLINGFYDNYPERSVLVVLELFALILVIPTLIYIILKRRSVDQGSLALIILITVSLLLVSIYLFRVFFYISFPADILLWTESDFVNDILKFRTGYPIYSAQQNNESSIYTPGTQILTYLLGRLTGNSSSIPLWRGIQLFYVFISSIVAVFCCRMITNIATHEQTVRNRGLWVTFWFLTFFLMATNSVTNRYVHTLHNDALTLMVSVIAYTLLVAYASNGSKRTLFMMAILPGLGFLIKQSLAVWAPLYCLFLVFFDKDRSFPRLLMFGLSSFGGIALSIAACYMFWGDDFIYWTFTVMGKHPTSILRSFQHFMEVWLYFVIGMLGGLIIIRHEKFKSLLGLWFIWLLLFLIEVYTSGIAWMVNHMGPGSMIAGIWFIGLAVKVWQNFLPDSAGSIDFQDVLKSVIFVLIACFLFSGLGFVRIPIKPLSDDSYRYINEIEKEFEGETSDKILLDIGSWIYLKKNIIMKDRGIAFGDRGYSEVGDFSGMIHRLNQKTYSKILVRNLHASDFIYDYWMWGKSSDIRKTILKNYYVEHNILPVNKNAYEEHPYYFFDEINVLLPKPEQDGKH